MCYDFPNYSFLVVLHLINTLRSGGAEHFLKEVVCDIQRFHPEIQNVVVTIFESGPVKDLLPPNIEYHCLESSKLNFFFKVPALRKILSDYKIDVIHTHLYEATILARLARKRGERIISTYHSGMHDRNERDFSLKRLWLDRATLTPDHTLIFVSQGVASQNINELKRHKNWLVMDNYPSSRFGPKYRFKVEDGKAIQFVAVGRLDRDKNYMLAISAFSKFNSDQVQLDIYGDGTLKDELNAAISSSVDCPVRLMGSERITSELLAKYDVFLMTSLSEGMPIALLEAIATGMPALLNDIPVLRETASSVGIYFEAHNLEALENSIADIIKHPNVLFEHAKATKEIAQRRTAEKYINQLVGVYKDVQVEEVCVE